MFMSLRINIFCNAKKFAYNFHQKIINKKIISNIKKFKKVLVKNMLLAYNKVTLVVINEKVWR